MKIEPTIEGGLRIDPESEEDWYILRAIILDANNCETDLATRQGNLITNEKITEDWQEIIVPDLRETFNDALHYVRGALEAASAFPKDGEHPIWITREDALTWYSALNQARLALEEKFKFGTDPESDAANLAPVRHEALLRNHFYTALQSFILNHAMSQ